MTCLKIFDGIVNSPSFMEKEKRIKSVYIESIRVARCTVRKIHLSTQKQYNLNISLRKVFNLKRFFITNATEKEKIFCIRKRSLNTALSFDKLISPNNDNNLPVYSSISEYLTGNVIRTLLDIINWSAISENVKIALIKQYR